MITFPYVEDYLEVLGGYRQITASGRSPGPASVFGMSPGPVSLARYDVGIVQSMASHTVNNGSLTDRQSELVVKIIGKYQRQFRNLGVDVTDIVANPRYRFPIRVVDRTKSISIENNQILVRFPYDKTIIGHLGTAAKENHGSCTFDRENKFWLLGLTTYNVNWAVTMAKEYGFALDSTLLGFMQSINQIEQSGYKIELRFAANNELEITNAAPSLIDYITKHLGGLNVNNLVKLIDYAPILGYTVHTRLLESLEQQNDELTLSLLKHRQSHYARMDAQSSGIHFLLAVKKYADSVNRYPIYVYEADASNRLKDTLGIIFQDNEIADITNVRSLNYLDNPDLKCVYFNKIKKSVQQPIPLLISTSAMLYGADKQYMLQLAEKVVYFTSTTLNKEATTIASEADNQG